MSLMCVVVAGGSRHWTFGRAGWALQGLTPHHQGPCLFQQHHLRQAATSMLTHWGPARTQVSCPAFINQQRSSSTCCQSGQQDSEQAPQQPDQDSEVPSFMTGVNWFCYSALGLLFLTDFTPLGSAIQASENPGVALALLQWCAFVLPTLWFSCQEQYSLRKTFQLNSCGPTWLAAAAAAGPALFLVVTTLVRLRLGVDQGTTVAVSSGMGPGWAASQPLTSLLPLYVLSPAVAEELLFRGFLLTALRQRLGKVDSVAVSGALFALMHLSVEQFFQYSLLGFACGAASVSADSIVPAVVLHASYNLAAVLLAAASGGS